MQEFKFALTTEGRRNLQSQRASMSILPNKKRSNINSTFFLPGKQGRRGTCLNSAFEDVMTLIPKTKTIQEEKATEPSVCLMSLFKCESHFAVSLLEFYRAKERTQGWDPTFCIAT
jgi:hypothetical protein